MAYYYTNGITSAVPISANYTSAMMQQIRGNNPIHGPDPGPPPPGMGHTLHPPILANPLANLAAGGRGNTGPLNPAPNMKTTNHANSRGSHQPILIKEQHQTIHKPTLPPARVVPKPTTNKPTPSSTRRIPEPTMHKSTPHQTRRIPEPTTKRPSHRHTSSASSTDSMKVQVGGSSRKAPELIIKPPVPGILPRRSSLRSKKKPHTGEKRVRFALPPT